MSALLRRRWLAVSRSISLIGAAVLILGLGIGIGSSLGIPGLSITRANGGSHHACVNISTGQMRYAFSAAQCTQNEYPISFGEPGIPGYELLQSEKIPVAAGETEIHRLTCPNGKQIISGGGVASYVAETNPAAPEPNMFWSFPFDEHSWQIAVYNDSGQVQEMRAYAICAYATS
jgi:hypothetical protein